MAGFGKVEVVIDELTPRPKIIAGACHARRVFGLLAYSVADIAGIGPVLAAERSYPIAEICITQPQKLLT